MAPRKKKKQRVVKSRRSNETAPQPAKPAIGKVLGRPLFLSIPIKVLLVTACFYIASFSISTVVISLAGFKISPALLWPGLISLTAIAATLSTYLFLDRPLSRLMHVMRRAQEGDFLTRVGVSGDDELDMLAKNLNQVLSRVTDLHATKIQTEQDLLSAQEELKLKAQLEEKSRIIEKTNSALEELVKDLQLVYEIGQGVNSTIELSELYQVITNVLQKQLKLEEFAILLIDDSRESLSVRAAYGFPEEARIFDVAFRIGEGITGRVAKEGIIIYVKDTSQEKEFLHYKGERHIEGSFLSIPLKFKKEVLGVINFARPGVDSFAKEEIRILTLVADQIALAIENAKLYTQARELSVRDDLTGLYNRRHFQTVLNMEWKRAIRFKRSLSLLMMDVDHFKEYNDTFGHLEGDKVLKEMSALLKRNLREVDTIARFGGEEFILLLPDTDKKGAIAVGEKLRRLIESTMFNKGLRGITISSGISSYPEDVRELDDLIDHADIALYDAKDAGRNRVISYPELSMPTSIEMVRNSKKMLLDS